MAVSRVALCLVAGVFWLGAAAPVAAATVSIAWDQNPEPDVTNYNVFVTTNPGSYGTGVAVGNRTSWTFTGLLANRQYYFAVQAQSVNGLSPLALVGFLTPTTNLPGSEASRADFDSDGKFDLLWQHRTNGQLIAWHMNGAVVLSSRFLVPSSVGAGWKLRGSGDLNQDGKPDLVWQNTVTGELVYYLMDGVMAFGSGYLTPNRVGLEWQISSIRDMDRDGHPDVVWSNVNTGQVLAWYMNGTTMVRQGWLNATPLTDTNWKLRGTGDFNRDGQADLVWQHEVSGQPLLWLMSGASATSGVMMSNPGSGAWKIRAIGDANVDGNPDLVFENSSTGVIVIWAMNGSQAYSGPVVGTVDPLWEISSPH